MRDIPIGLVIATVSICAAVCAVCLVCVVAWWPFVVAWWPSYRNDVVHLLDEDEPEPGFGVPPAIQEARRDQALYGAPTSSVVDFRRSGAKGFGVRKGRPS